MQIIYPIIWLCFIICGFFVWFFWHRANHRERMLKMEKGIDEKEITIQKNASPSFWLRFASLITGLSIGLLIISILVSNGMLDKGGNALPIAIMGLCGGISMIVAHYLQAGKSKSE